MRNCLNQDGPDLRKRRMRYFQNQLPRCARNNGQDLRIGSIVCKPLSSRSLKGGESISAYSLLGDYNFYIYFIWRVIALLAPVAWF